VALIEPDERRRGEASRLIFQAGHHVEPYENLQELQQHWPQAGVVMLCDQPAVLDEIFELMIDKLTWQPVLIYSETPCPERIVDVVLQGAMDYLAWPIDPQLFKERLRKLLTRNRSFTELRRRALKAQRLVDGLSKREREVLFGLASGKQNKDIARNLEISPRTVEIHRANMLGKLGARRSQEAIAVALFAQLKNIGEGWEESYRHDLLSD
jgi:FixJ family two-component response regulator